MMTVIFFTSACLHVVLDMRRDVVPVISLFAFGVVQKLRLALSRVTRSRLNSVRFACVTAVGKWAIDLRSLLILEFGH